MIEISIYSHLFIVEREMTVGIKLNGKEDRWKVILAAVS